jgi:hypothetical protein
MFMSDRVALDGLNHHGLYAYLLAGDALQVFLLWPAVTVDEMATG